MRDGLSAAGLSGTSTAVYAATIEPERLVTTSYRLTPPGWNAGRLSVVAIALMKAGVVLVMIGITVASCLAFDFNPRLAYYLRFPIEGSAGPPRAAVAGTKSEQIQCGYPYPQMPPQKL